MAELFGFEIRRKKEDEEGLKSFAPPANEDGSLIVAGGGLQGTYIDLSGAIRTEAELVTKYRQVAMDPIVDQAIQDVVNEAIVEDSDDDVVSITLDDLKVSDGIKTKITKEFDEVLRLLEFNQMSYDIFRRWYIDGRLYYHVMIDEEKTADGIKQLRYIDPRNIKKVREVKKEKDPHSGITTERIVNEYYVFNKSGFMSKAGSAHQIASAAENVQGIKIAKDSIAYCTSGYQNEDNSMILSYLHKALRPFNQLRSIEDALIIYRISRAPERRIFYIDVGGLPKAKAEQYVRDQMARFKNRTVYDSSTGTVKDDRKFMTMLEDFWLPRRDGSRGTEITTLPGGQNLGELEDVNYFQGLLFRSLGVPMSRLQPDSQFTLGRATEISRDEIKFAKFIGRLRNKFATLFINLLERQLILKGICSPEDWRDWKPNISFDFAVDNYFDELKHNEILRERINLVRDIDEYTGKYYSHEFVRRFVLKQSEEDIKEIDKQIKEEEKDPRYADMDDDFGLSTNSSPRQPAPRPSPQPRQQQPATDPSPSEPDAEREQQRDREQQEN